MQPVKLIETDIDDLHVLQKQRNDFLKASKTRYYTAAFRNPEPLVSVCITTSDRGEILAERALTSMRNQIYKNLQVIIVGDCCNDDTAARIDAFNDDRFLFINLPKRGPYPRPGIDRWRVAGTYPVNEALRRAKGDFVTHIDEDDTFSDDRIASLVKTIQASEADLVFHPFWWQEEDGSWILLGNGTFEHAQTGTSMVLYHRWFARIPWDVFAFRLGEPGDWNRLRKFKAIGARTEFVPTPLTWHWRYPERGPFVPKEGEEFLD